LAAVVISITLNNYFANRNSSDPEVGVTRETTKNTAAATTSATTPSPTTSRSNPATTGPTRSEQEEAEDLVTAWADATTRRDFTDAARIDPTKSPHELEMMYGSADDPVRMFSVRPYFADATQDGEVWTLTGAVIAWDYDPQPTIRTHVVCSEWEVDLDAGTAAWTIGASRFFPGELIPREQFADAYDATCA
jgi:hypothetical protein